MLSHLFTALSLCAIIITVLFLSKLNIKSIIFSWAALSNDEVASSNITICASLSNALAMDNLCFCPPDNLIPLSPTTVSNPLGESKIISYKPTFFAIVTTFSIDMFSFKRVRLFFIVSFSRKTSCETMSIFSLNLLIL